MTEKCCGECKLDAVKRGVYIRVFRSNRGNRMWQAHIMDKGNLVFKLADTHEKKNIIMRTVNKFAKEFSIEVVVD